MLLLLWMKCGINCEVMLVVVVSVCVFSAGGRFRASKIFLLSFVLRAGEIVQISFFMFSFGFCDTLINSNDIVT